MRILEKRMRRLEGHFHPPNDSDRPRRVSRLVVCEAGGPEYAAPSSCKRTLYPDGRLMEQVYVPGGGAPVSREEFEQLIESFPVEVL